jgi:hypothetical protein
MVRQFPSPSKPDRQSRSVFAPALSPDGRCVAAGYGDGTVRLWEMASGQLRAHFNGHRDAATSVTFSPDGTLLVSGSGDQTLLTWDLTGRRTSEPPAEVSDTALVERWNDLAAEDAGKAFHSIQALWASGGRSVRLIAERLRPVAPTDPATLTLVADLDSDRFATRQKAEAALVELGATAEPALRTAIERQPSAEARRRIEVLLEKLDPVRSPNTLRQIRAVEVLERVGTREAKLLLEKLARGVAEARLTREAKAALDRAK